MIRLGVNIDHVATVRQARRTYEPDPVTAACLAILGGADGITVHLREDRRHIQDRDVRILKQTVNGVRLNLEMSIAPDIVAIALETRPDEATLVPEKREELTTEGGLDIVTHAEAVGPVVKKLKDSGILVSLFIDPDIEQIDIAQALGADAIEFQTASYSEAHTPAAVAEELAKLTTASLHARNRGLHIHMGHGLNYHNVQDIVRIPHVEELNIGHSIISRAVLVGLERAVREMKQAMMEHAQYPKRG
jgi:pyridoxine 5-phosphate synthase